jgi:hypothetical protein
MKIIFDTETKRFSIVADDDSKYMESKSDEFVYNAIRVILRPWHTSVSHWVLDEMYAQTSNLTRYTRQKSRKLEYLYSSIGGNCSSQKLFYFDKLSLEGRIEDIKAEPYGEYRSLISTQTVALGLLILLDLLRTKTYYPTKVELKSIYIKWIDIMKSNFGSEYVEIRKRMRIRSNNKYIPIISDLG